MNQQLSLRSEVLWGLLVVVLVWWTARAVIGFELLAWDDELNIVINPHLGPPTAGNLAWMFSDIAYMRRYVPFGWLGFSVAYAFSGLSPVAYHVGNLFLHVCNALLLYLVITTSLRRFNPELGQPSWIAPAAAAGALCWALHPLRAETIGWASGMLYSLACAFALLSVIAYFRSVERSPGGFSRPWRWIAVLLYAVSMLTYPVTLGLIAVFVAIDVAEWHRNCALGTFRRTTLDALCVAKLPFIAAVVAVAAITLFGRFTAGSFWGVTPSLVELSITDRVARAFYTIAYYPWRTCWPVNLTPFPMELSDFTRFGPAAVLSVLLVVGFTLLLWRGRVRRPGALLLWACYLVMLTPMLGFTEKQYYPSDRYSYLPAMTLGLALAWALLSFSRARSWIPAGAMGAALIAMAAMTSVQLRVWRDSPTLFAHCVAVADNAKSRANIYQRWVTFHVSRGRVDDAAAVLALADREGVRGPIRDEMAADLVQARVEVSQGGPPLVARIHADIALRLAREGRASEANEHFAAALQLAPRFAATRYNQALHAAASGDARTALRLFLTALAHANGAINVTAQQHAWSMIAAAFTHSHEPELARQAARRASLLMESDVGPTPRVK